VRKSSKLAKHHLRKARKHFEKVKDRALAEGLRRLSTGLLRMNGVLKHKDKKKRMHPSKKRCKKN